MLRNPERSPFADRGDADGGFAADGQLVIAGGGGAVAVAVEPADAAFRGAGDNRAVSTATASSSLMPQ